MKNDFPQTAFRSITSVHMWKTCWDGTSNASVTEDGSNDARNVWVPGVGRARPSVKAPPHTAGMQLCAGLSGAVPATTPARDGCTSGGMPGIQDSDPVNRQVKEKTSNMSSFRGCDFPSR